MKAYVSKVAAPCFGVILAALIQDASAQEQPTAAEVRPAPGSAVVPVQTDEEPASGETAPLEATQAGSVGFVRLWNYSTQLRQHGIAILLRGGKAQADAETGEYWLARGSRYGESRNYREILPGKYRVLAVPDDSRQGAMIEIDSKAVDETRSVAPSQTELAVAPGRYQTLLLRSRNEKLDVVVLEDTSEQMVRGSLRIYNFHPTIIPSVSDPLSNPVRVLAQNVGHDVLVVDSGKRRGLALFEVTVERPGFSEPARMTAEADYTDAWSCSLIFYEDRYSRPAVLVCADAPASALAALRKQP